MSPCNEVDCLQPVGTTLRQIHLPEGPPHFQIAAQATDVLTALVFLIHLGSGEEKEISSESEMPEERMVYGDSLVRSQAVCHSPTPLAQIPPARGR